MSRNRVNCVRPFIGQTAMVLNMLYNECLAEKVLLNIGYLDLGHLTHATKCIGSHSFTTKHFFPVKKGYEINES